MNGYEHTGESNKHACSELHMMRSVDPSILSKDVKFLRKMEKGMFITEE